MRLPDQLEWVSVLVEACGLMYLMFFDWFVAGFVSEGKSELKLETFFQFIVIVICSLFALQQ